MTDTKVQIEEIEAQMTAPSYPPVLSSQDLPPPTVRFVDLKTRRGRIVQRALYASLGLVVIAFGFSMGAYFGYFSYFVATVTNPMALALIITMLLITHKEEKQHNASPSQHLPAPNQLVRLPAIYRKPSIMSFFFVALMYAGTCAVILSNLAIWWKFEMSDNQSLRFLVVLIMELIFSLGTLVTLVVIGVFASKGRKEALGARPNEAAWYDLGYYEKPPRY